MPSSDAAPVAADRAWLPVLKLAGAVLAIALAVAAARTVWFDAYWLFRQNPPWRTETGGENRLLDRQTRRAKTLQGLTRGYRVALVGSSTVYHGLDPRDVDRSHGTAFNLGISALMADELPTIARLVSARDTAGRVTIGLDYYMFSRRSAGPRVNASLDHPIGRLGALFGSVVSRYALSDSRLSEVAGGSDPGAWTREGFRVTPALAPSLTLANDAVRRRTTASYLPERGTSVMQALDTLREREVTVYLSPVSQAQRRVMADLGLMDDFERWRADMAALATARRVPFLDLADLGADVPFEPGNGSNEIWLDNLHFTPVLGRRVLERLGLRGTGAP